MSRFHIPTEFPDSWKKWPLSIEVSFKLTKWNAIGRGSYEAFRVQSLQTALENLLDPIHAEKHEFAGYRFFAPVESPEFEWYVSWPVRRRGSVSEIQKSKKRQAAAPWDWHPDNTVFELSNKPRGSNPFDSRVTLMLRTGGRTKADAVKNWEVCAISLRKALAELGSYQHGASPAWQNTLEQIASGRA